MTEAAQDPYRGRSKGEILHIRTYRQIGESLAAELNDESPFVVEMSGLLHDTPLTYSGILTQYFFESGRSIGELAKNPLVRAFRDTPVCKPEEAEFLDELERRVAEQLEPDDETIAVFNEWVGVRLPILVKGFQRFILDGGVITPLTPEEIAKKNRETTKNWREANPEEFTRIQRSATEAATAAAKPRVFTDEVREQMQRWFDKGLEYETVIEMLRGIGVNVGIESLKSAVSNYEDLTYTPELLKAEKRKGFEKALTQVFALANSRSKTVEIFEALGYKPDTIRHSLARLGLRTRFRWELPMEFEGQEITGIELASSFMKSSEYSSIRKEYEAFMDHLKLHGLEPRITYASYKQAKDRYFKPKP